MAATLLVIMAEVFDEPATPAEPGYLRQLLQREDVWIYAALEQGRPIGGLTAFVLPVPRIQASELLIYDIAVSEARQRQGIGRALLQAALDAARQAGLVATWVPADNADQPALDFYRAVGASAAATTIFTFAGAD